LVIVRQASGLIDTGYYKQNQQANPQQNETTDGKQAIEPPDKQALDFLIGLLAAEQRVLLALAQAPLETSFSLVVDTRHQLFLKSLLSDYSHQDAGGEYKNQDDSQLVKSFVRTAADRIDFAAAAQARAQTGAAGLDQNQNRQ
jgi:hypothetical protein